MGEQSADVGQILDWILTEIGAGMSLSRGPDSQLWNSAHERCKSIIYNYKRGDGLFQMTSRSGKAMNSGLSRDRIEAEIKALEPLAKDYDTERQSNDTCLAAGAHDALRWALGLAEDSISETIKAK